MTKCIYCRDHLRHPLFVYLLTDRRYVNNPMLHDVVPYVGVSSNPYLYLRAHNRDDKRYVNASQVSKPGAGFYQLELVCGPLWSGAREFKKQCRTKKRKIKNRINFFCKYALALQKKSQQQHRNHIPILYVRDEQYVRRVMSEMSNSDKND